MKPVQLKGIFDTSKEIQVEKFYRGEKGVQIIVPFYTHLDSNGKECAILVNRGWVPFDLKDQRLHSVVQGKVKGVLYRGDAKTKYSVPNSPTISFYQNVTPYDLAVVDQLPNLQEASQFMLHQVDFDEDRKQVLPSLPSAKDLQNFHSSPERHAAYESMWRMMTFAGVVANTAMWLYI